MNKTQKIILGLILIITIITIGLIGLLIKKGILKIRAIPENYYALYSKPLFDVILPDTTPSDSEKINSISLTATPGEFEPASFAVFAKTNLSNFTVSVSDLVDMAGNRISKENFDARVVKVWEQAPGWRWKQGWAKVLTPELLLKDDTQEIFSGNWSVPSNLPDLVLTGDPKTNIAQNQSKQFWIIIKIPQDAKSGEYRGKISLQASNVPTAEIPITLKVLAFNLVDPTQINKILGTYFSSTFLSDPNTGQPKQTTVSKELFKKQLRNIREHGLNSIMLNLWFADTDDKARETINYVKEAGFRNPKNNTIILSGWHQSLPWPQRPEIPRNIQIAQQFGFDAYYLTGDEPSETNLEKLETYCERAKLVKDYGIKNTVTIWKEMADLFEKPYTFSKCGKWSQEPVTYTLPVDMPIYAIVDPVNHPAVFNYIQGLQSGTITKNSKTELYYWQLWVPKMALANRLLYGFYLAYSGLDGVYPFTYQDLVNPGNPYDDFDVPDQEGYTYSYYGVTYPLKNDILETIGWEAVREGIDDLRYLETLKKKIQETRTSRPELNKQISQIENEIADKVASYKNLTAKPQIAAKDIEDTRKFLQDKIIQIMTLSNVGGGNGTNDTGTGGPTPGTGVNNQVSSNQIGKIFNYPSPATGPVFWLVILLALGTAIVLWLVIKKKK